MLACQRDERTCHGGLESLGRGEPERSPATITQGDDKRWQLKSEQDNVPAACCPFGMHTKRIRRRRTPRHYEMVQRQRW